MFNLLAANLHDGNAYDLTSSLGLIGKGGRDELGTTQLFIGNL